MRRSERINRLTPSARPSVGFLPEFSPIQWRLGLRAVDAQPVPADVAPPGETLQHLPHALPKTACLRPVTGVSFTTAPITAERGGFAADGRLTPRIREIDGAPAAPPIRSTSIPGLASERESCIRRRSDYEFRITCCGTRESPDRGSTSGFEIAAERRLTAVVAAHLPAAFPHAARLARTHSCARFGTGAVTVPVPTPFPDVPCKAYSSSVSTI